MCECVVCIYVCALCARLAPTNVHLKKVYALVEFQVIVSHSVDNEDYTQVLHKSKPLSILNLKASSLVHI